MRYVYLALENEGTVKKYMESIRSHNPCTVLDTDSDPGHCTVLEHQTP